MQETGAQSEGTRAVVSPGTTKSRRAEIALVSVALAVAAAFLANLVDFGYGRDQGIYAVVADAVQRGDAPYRAAWDFKPPGIYFVFALAEILFGADQRAVRVLEGLCLLSLFPAFALFSRRHVGSARAGLLGAALAGTANNRTGGRTHRCTLPTTIFAASKNTTDHPACHGTTGRGSAGRTLAGSLCLCHGLIGGGCLLGGLR